MLKYFIKNLLFVFLSFMFMSCSSKIPSIKERTNDALSLASKSNLEEFIINSTNFNIFSLQSQNINCENRTLNIYIEGDGLAWISRSQVSQNPNSFKATIT
jgi:hypothetical protein